MARILYLGHSSFKLELGNTTAFVDLFLSHAGRVVPPAANLDAIRRADYIFVTHEHADHCDKPVVEDVVSRTGATVIAPRPALAQLEIPEQNKMAVHSGDRFSLGELEVRVVNAVHPKSSYPVGFVIEKGASVYHAGDTYAFREMNGIKCDYALLPVGGASTMDTLGASKAVWDLKPKNVVPMHFDTFPQIRQDVSAWVRGLEHARGIKLRPGEELVF